MEEDPNSNSDDYDDMEGLEDLEVPDPDLEEINNLQAQLEKMNVDEVIGHSSVTKDSAAATSSALIPEGPQSNLQNQLDEIRARQKLIRRLLALLVHTHKCQMHERHALKKNEQFQCSLPQCQPVKNVLTHLLTCNSGLLCSFPLCSSIRKIIDHWKQCTASSCVICFPGIQQFRDRLKNKAKRAVKIQAMHLEVRKKKYIPRALPTGTSLQLLLNTYFSQDPFQVDLKIRAKRDSPRTSPYGSNPTSIEATPVEKTKEWHELINPECRNGLVRKLFQAIWNILSTQAMLQRRKNNLVTYVQKIETDFYQMADSRSEYYHLIAEKIYKTQKELEAKKLQKDEGQACS